LDNWSIPVIKAIATKHEGVEELISEISKHQKTGVNTKRSYLLAEKAYRLIQNKHMKDISKQQLKEAIEAAMKKEDFNLYRFVKVYE
jgi:LAO/AO transport system kinase